MNTKRFTARCFISSCSGLLNPCTTSTNPVTDLHFDTKNNGCRQVVSNELLMQVSVTFGHIDYNMYTNTQMHIYNLTNF